MGGIKNIVFDFGGVLVDWNPQYLYGKLFDTKDEMEYFLRKSAMMSGTYNKMQDDL